MNSSSEAISSAWIGLQRQWADTRDGWADAVADRYEREFWTDWADALPQCLDSLRALEEALTEALSQTDYK